MRVDIVLDEGSDERSSAAASLTSLYRWLAQDPDVAQQAEVALESGRPGAGEMGDAFEVINVVVTHTLALGSLAVACATWRASRPSAPAVRIERDGVTVTVEDGSPEAVRRVVDALSAPRPPADDGEGTGQRQ